MLDIIYPYGEVDAHDAWEFVVHWLEVEGLSPESVVIYGARMSVSEVGKHLAKTGASAFDIDGGGWSIRFVPVKNYGHCVFDVRIDNCAGCSFGRMLSPFFFMIG